MKKIFTLISLTILISGCASHKFKGYTKYTNTNRVTKSSTLQFVELEQQPPLLLGQANPNDSASASGAMVYPGGFGIGGFIASVATHAAIENSAAEARKNKIQEEANKVTKPFQNQVSKMDTRRLYKKTISQQNVLKSINIVEKDNMENTKTIEFAPVFFMSQDKSQVYVRNVAVVYHPKQKKKPFYQNQVEVFSKHTKTSESIMYWKDNLERTLESLFNESTNLLLQDMVGSSKFTSTDENIHYTVGSEKYFERGKVLDYSCEFILLKTLRNWLKLIPKKNIQGTKWQNCDPSKQINAISSTT